MASNTKPPVAIVLWSVNKTDPTGVRKSYRTDLNAVMPKLMIMHYNRAFDHDNAVTVKVCNFRVEGDVSTQFSLVNSWADPIVVYRHALGDAARVFLSAESPVCEQHASASARAASGVRDGSAGYYTFGSVGSSHGTTSVNRFNAIFVSGATAIDDILDMPTFVENAERIPLIKQLDNFLLERAFVHVPLQTSQNPTLMPHSLFQATETLQPMFALFAGAR